jgi:glutamyl-tRNA reductase
MRERLAVVPGEIEPRLQSLVGLDSVTEAVLLSTCNRIEIYAVTSDRITAFSSLHDHLCERLQHESVRARDLGPMNPSELETHLYRRHGRAAVHHLFRVAASLDSLVVGEPQILGQVKEAFEVSLRVGGSAAGSLLGDSFTRAFRVARRVRRETGIAKNPVSVSGVAVEMARQVFAGFDGRRVLVVGAGKMSDLAARALRAQGASVAVTNRTRARADALAERLGCVVEPWEDLAGAVVRADIVITSTGSRTPIFLRDDVERVQKRRKKRSLVLIDIAVPRDVDPGVSALPGVFLWDIDDLQKEAAVHLAGRREEAEKAESVVEEEVSKFFQAVRGRSVGPVIAALRARVNSIAEGEMEKMLPAIAGDKDRTQARRLVESVIAKVLHAPQVALRKGAATEEGELLAAAAQRLFDLPSLTVVEGGVHDAEKQASQESAQDTVEEPNEADESS